MIGFSPHELGVDFRVLSDEDKDEIHWNTLDVLENTGVRIHYSEDILELLDQNGCDVDYGQELVQIPPHLVQDALNKKNPTVTLCGRNSEHDAKLDDRRVYMTNDGNGTSTIDFETGKKRASTKQDIADTATITDALDIPQIYWPMVSAQDVPASVRPLHDLQVSMANTEKHVMFETTVKPEIAKYQIEMASAVVGGRDELKKRPIVSSLHCPVAPLQHGGPSTEAAIEFAKAGVPIVFFAMPQPGATGPATLAGSMVVNNAEVLSGLVISQLAASGSKVIYGGGVGVFDMKTGTRGGGGPEHALTGAAFAEMARYYSMPSIVAGGVSQAKEPGPQAAYEAFTTILPQMLSGANAMCGIGLLDDASLLTLEELLIDAEIVRIAQQLARGITVNDETLATEVIKEVGPAGHYLTHQHTLDRFKEEHFSPSLSERKSYEDWEKGGRKSVVDKARKRAKSLLKNHEPKPLPDSAEKEIDELIKEAERTFNDG